MPHQPAVDAFSKDLWSKALQKLSDRDRATILGLIPSPDGSVNSGALLLDELYEMARKQKVHWLRRSVWRLKH